MEARKPRSTVLFAGYYSADDDFPRHQHPVWEIVYYTTGRIRMSVGAGEAEAGPGELIATPPGIPHAVTTLAPYDSIYVVLDPGPDASWPLVVRDGLDGRIRRVLEAIVAEHATSSDGMTEVLVAELDILLGRMAGPPASARARLVAQAEALMRRELARGPSVTWLAEQLAVAPSTLRLAFARERGTSPRSALAALRLWTALGYLRTSGLTLEAVARLAGYDSASHLSRAVKTATGEAPGRIRRSTEPPAPLPDA
jgi:AraC-like DNA-binding protein